MASCITDGSFLHVYPDTKYVAIANSTETAYHSFSMTVIKDVNVLAIVRGKPRSGSQPKYVHYIFFSNA